LLPFSHSIPSGCIKQQPVLTHHCIIRLSVMTFCSIIHGNSTCTNSWLAAVEYGGEIWLTAYTARIPKSNMDLSCRSIIQRHDLTYCCLCCRESWLGSKNTVGSDNSPLYYAVKLLKNLDYHCQFEAKFENTGAYMWLLNEKKKPGRKIS
jgi:hypothetical protein